MSSSTFSGDETAPFFGFLGAAAALVFSCMGEQWGFSGVDGCHEAGAGDKVYCASGYGLMAGVLGIYGLIIAVIISTGACKSSVEILISNKRRP